MAAKNKVIAGDYENKVVMATGGKVLIAASITNTIILSATNVVNYEVMNTDSRKSATSAVGRGLIGNFLVGPIGTVAALSAKNKNTYIVAVEFKDGKRSLLEIDDKIYKALIAALYTYKTANNGVFNPNITEGKYAPIMGEKSDTAKLFGKIGKGFIIFMIIGTIFMMIEGIIK